MNADLKKRSVDSLKWTVVSSVLRNFLGFAQNVILVRLLPVESFGIYAGAASVVIIASSIATFGLGSAYIHRSEETEDIENASAIHFTLQLMLNVIWTILMLAGGFLFIDRNEAGLLTTYIVLTLTFTVYHLSLTPNLYLQRQVKFKRFAILGILTVIITFITTIPLALLKLPVWALLAPNIINSIMHIVVFYFWKPIWHPRLLWSVSGFKYFLGFGSNQVLARLLLNALDKGDELWAKIYLGSKQLGFYSRAYSFASFPSDFLSNPIKQVAGNTYAELKGDRKGLSEAFFETNSLIARGGFLIVGILALVAPEFIRIVMGENWIPMLTTFRLMLPFTMFDPMKQTMASLFTAVGKPGRIVEIRAIQLGVLLVSIFTLGLPFGIEGIAIAVDIMMIVGIVLTLIKVRPYVDVSIKDLFLYPFIALFLGILVSLLMGWIPGIAGNDWASGLIKAITFMIVFLLVLWRFEKKQLVHLMQIAKKYIGK